MVAANVGNDKQPLTATVALAAVGEDRPATDLIAVYDWRRRSVVVLPAAGAYDIALESAEWDYRVLAPVLPGDIAVIGDPALYACAGDSRVADVVVEPDGAGVTVTLLGANERVHVVGWSRQPIAARAWAPSTGASEISTTHDAATGMWALALDIGAVGWATLLLVPAG